MAAAMKAEESTELSIDEHSFTSSPEETGEALQAALQRYRALVDLTADYAYSFRVLRDGTVDHEWGAGSLARLSGYTAQELRSQDGWETLIHPDDLSIPVSQLRCLLTGKDCVVTYRIVTRDGSVRWIKDCARPMWSDQQGRVIRIVGALQDVSDQVRAEEALQESETILQATIENLPFDAFVIGMDGRYMLQNSACSRHWGDLIGKRPEEIAPSLEALALWQDAFRRAIAGETVEDDIQYTVAGERRDFHSILAPITHRDEIRSVLGINIDITDGSLGRKR